MADNSAVYPWQHTLWQHLISYIGQQRIPQALLITGAKGVGKRHLADAFAQVLLCQKPLADHLSCGECHGCKLWQAQTHPDYLAIEPDEPGKTIGIDKIRQLIVKLALKPQFDTQRLIIIQPADQLNNASANAFLKCLEEPTERTCLILLTDNPSRLPATIRSRCQIMHCQKPDKQIAGQWLQQQGINEHHDLLLRFAQGSPLLAKLYADRQFIDIRQDCFNAWLQVLDGKKNLVSLAEQWDKQDKVDLGVLLTWMLTWVMDIIKSAHSADLGQLQNPDMEKPLQALAKRLELQRVYRFYDSLLVAQSQVNKQINKQLLLEQLFINWMLLNTR